MWHLHLKHTGELMNINQAGGQKTSVVHGRILSLGKKRPFIAGRLLFVLKSTIMRTELFSPHTTQVNLKVREVRV